MTIKYIGDAVRWFDKSGGNTYHSVRVTRVKDAKIIICPMTYGYDEAYRQTALKAMTEKGWIKNYKGKEWAYERENKYPIYWTVSEGTKKECLLNGGEQK